jgi:hypothetical protein
MTESRTQAYLRVVNMLDEVGPTKLHAAEQAVIRETADALIFASTFEDDPEANDAVDALALLAGRLSSSGRWTEDRVEQLVDDILSCGPVEALAPAERAQPATA